MCCIVILCTLLDTELRSAWPPKLHHNDGTKVMMIQSFLGRTRILFSSNLKDNLSFASQPISKDSLQAERAIFVLLAKMEEARDKGDE